MDNPRNDTNDRERDEESGAAATADELQRRQRGSLPSFLFITFLFFMLTNRNEEGVVGRSQYEDAVRALGYQLSNYSAWLNGTATNFSLVRSNSYFLCHVLDPPLLARARGTRRTTGLGDIAQSVPAQPVAWILLFQRLGTVPR
jgi:hypothetical protein